jgi:hypothetical protein
MPKPPSKEARSLAIAKRLMEIEMELRPLLKAKKELTAEHALLFKQEQKQVVEQAAPKKSRPRGEETLKARVIAFFSNRPPGEIHLKDIVAGLGGDVSRDSLGATLSILKKEGRLDATGRGTYSLAVTNVRHLHGG